MKHFKRLTFLHLTSEMMLQLWQHVVLISVQKIVIINLLPLYLVGIVRIDLYVMVINCYL